MSTVDPDRWKVVSPYLDQVLETPEEERAAWLVSFAAEARQWHCHVVLLVLGPTRILPRRAGPWSAQHARRIQRW